MGLTRSEIMSRIGSKNTNIEIVLRKALWKEGIRFRINVKSILGTPDIAIKKYKIAVFCDSEFWHGREFLENRFKIKSNKQFWENKIKKNILRDAYVTNTLTENGWEVIRFWGMDILKNTERCVKIVLSAIQEKNTYK